MRISIGNGAIEIDGQGSGVTVAELQRVAALFEQIFGVPPRIRMTGRFGREAIGYVDGADPNVDVWDLRRVSGSGYCPVLAVGSEYIYVQAFSGLNNNRSIALAPERGICVKIRLLLPSS